MSFRSTIEKLAPRLVARWRQRAVGLKAVSFALIGVINAAVDAAIFFLALATITSSLVAANVLGWLIAVSGSYVMNSFITFAAESGRKLNAKAYVAFVGSGIVAVTASTIALVVAAQYMPVWAAKGVAILVSFVVNFTITNFVVFRPRPAEPR